VITPPEIEADAETSQTKPADLGDPLPPGYTAEASAGQNMKLPADSARATSATIRKHHHAAEACTPLVPVATRTVAPGVCVTANYTPAAFVAGYQAHGAPTPHGVYDLYFQAFDEQGNKAEVARRFNYVFRPTFPLERFYQPVANRDFWDFSGELVYEAVVPRKGYSSSNIRQAFDFERNFMVEGSFLLSCRRSIPCALEIGICTEEPDKSLRRQVTFILGDGGLSKISIKHRDDPLEKRQEWCASAPPGISLKGDGKTPNHFKILVREDESDPEVSCRVYLKAGTFIGPQYVKVFERKFSKLYVPSPLMWLKVAGWKAGRIKLQDFEVGEYNDQPINPPNRASS
jgi:hypothetical protein